MGSNNDDWGAAGSIIIVGWEYPWYAAWDLAFHTLPLAIVDPDAAKQQMELMLQGVYLHPSATGHGSLRLRRSRRTSD